jgi:peroxiredoxin
MSAACRAVEVSVSRQAVAGLIVAGALAVAALVIYRGAVHWTAPDFVLEDVHGKPVRLSNYRGKIVFINVWTTWCEPCRLEMPSMEVLHQRLRGDDFVMLGVSADADGKAVVGPFVRELGLTFPILLDPDGQVARRYRVTGYPETFIVDRNGSVVAHEIGPRDWTDKRIERALRALIDVESAVGSGPSDRRATQAYLNSTSRRPEGEGPEDTVLSALAVGNS